MEFDIKSIEIVIYGNNHRNFRKSLKAANVEGGCCLYLTHRPEFHEKDFIAVQEVYCRKRRVGRIYSKNVEILKQIYNQFVGKNFRSNLSGEGAFWQHFEIHGRPLRAILKELGKEAEFWITDAEENDLFARPDYFNRLIMLQMKRKMWEKKRQTSDFDDEEVCRPAGDD